MLDIREIEYWISRYENEADKLEHCVTLSALYYIRDHMMGTAQNEPRIVAYSDSAAPVEDYLDQYGDSEFLQSIAGKDAASAWSVMDEHMNTLRVINPRAYEGIMRKLNSL